MNRAITDIALGHLPDVVRSLGLKPFAADQLVRWVYKQRVNSFDQMTNLSQDARAVLGDQFRLSAVILERTLTDSDGTRKFLFGLGDGGSVESVLIPAEDGRHTLCVSTQAGCSLGCLFCRTGRMGLKRNLTQGEIIGQAVEVQRAIDHPLTNVVFMGMGEPLMNMEAVCGAIELLLDERAFGLSKRRITVSTAGLIPELKEFTRRCDVKIAISLNAARDGVRNTLMPINRRYPLSELMKFCRDYARTSKHRVTFEYILIDGVNDSLEEAKALLGLLTGIRAKINLIPFNSFPGTSWRPASDERMAAWQEFLAERGVQATIRASRGQQILAACGQLAINQ